MKDTVQIKNALDRAADTKALMIGEGALKSVPTMFHKLFGNSSAVIVADANTYQAAGAEVERYLRESGTTIVPSFIFNDPKLFAEWGYVEQLERYLSSVNATAVAVGSGVINDLTKIVSQHLHRRYMVVGTAASMDGYAAYGASITYKGNKQTFECAAPVGIVFDPRIAATAPKGMSASGYADLLAKIPAGADWIIADALGTDTIDNFAWNLVQRGLRGALSNPEGVSQGNVAETEGLAEGLIMSGFAMQAIQSSRPASGSEHQFSHYWDMRNLCFEGQHVSHGFKVGIGTLASTAMLELLLATDISKIDTDICAANWESQQQIETDIKTIFADSPNIMERAITETRGKQIDNKALKVQLDKFVSIWDSLKPKIARQIMPYDEIHACLKAVGAPYEPEQIGVTRSDLRDAFRAIPYMRSRFTAFDIICRLGLYDEFLAKLFGHGGRWEIKK